MWWWRWLRQQRHHLRQRWWWEERWCTLRDWWAYDVLRRPVPPWAPKYHLDFFR